jgi:hypothetical protein
VQQDWREPGQTSLRDLGAEVGSAERAVTQLEWMASSAGIARSLADAIDRLGPTVGDLDRSDSWPLPATAALLAAVRENSSLVSWLSVLPRLSRTAPSDSGHAAIVARLPTL